MPVIDPFSFRARPGAECTTRRAPPDLYDRPVIEILVVCTGNICRSPMAEALLREKLAQRGSDARVRSAGTMAWGGPPTPHAVDALRELGLDIGEHVSRQLTKELVHSADLVLGMTRDHVGRVGSLERAAASRAFLPGELIRLAGADGARPAAAPVRVWARQLTARRPDARVVGRVDDQVPDPIGEPFAVYRATAARLDRELAAVAALIVPEPPIRSSARPPR